VIGAGTFINPLIKVVVTVAILAAVYFFIVKPILDTTDDAFDQFGSFGDTRQAFEREVRQNDLPGGVGSYSISSDNEKAVEKATECLAEAGFDQQRAQKCVRGLEK
jgi:hypothetical protein